MESQTTTTIHMTPDDLREIFESSFKKVLSDIKPESYTLRESEYVYSIRELADFLQCSTTTCQKLKNSGGIRYKQYGRKCIFKLSEVLEDLENLKNNRITQYARKRNENNYPL